MSVSQYVGGYRLLHRLGIGGAGTVWCAEDEGGQKVALKMLHPALAATDEARARLVREARLVNAVRGGGVAHVLDIEVDDYQPFVVSELIEGPSLAEILTRGPLPVTDVAALSRGLYDTLCRIHTAKIVHRDVKPSNIIYSPHGPVLIDFGIALSEDDTRFTQTGLISGTAGFTAPELLRGQPANPASDWWAFAATLLYALSGQPPFGRGNSAHVLAQVMNGTPDVRGLPTELVPYFMEALSPELRTRPAPHVLVEAIEKYARTCPHPAPSSVVQTLALPMGAPLDAYETRTPDPHDRTQIPEPDSGSEATVALHSSSPYEIAGATTPLLENPQRIHQEDYRASQISESGATNPKEGADPASIVGATETLHRHERPLLPTAALPVEGTYPPQELLQDTYSDNKGVYSNDRAVGGSYEESIFTPQENEQPYTPRAPRPAHALSVASLLLIATVPVIAGAAGLFVVVCALVCLGMVGAIHDGRERRRARHGVLRWNDMWALFFMSPLKLVEVVLSLSAAALISGIVTAGLWRLIYEYLRTHARGIGVIHIGQWKILHVPEITWPWDVVTSAQGNLGTDSWVSAPPMFLIIVFLVWFFLFLLWVFPTSRHLRRGSACVFQFFLPAWWARAIAVILVILATGALWMVITGG
ncbi:serine/threonine-protein kinase [Schaalia sp. lx-100]|uniref:serine/threonine-protein kinase n=1 Tax=Schaalia sp. lx-100 TaxID=2899081 RepID=UPI001E46EE00|nr:serine/threonine protein kinase [Schaalia sp. lx-100]